MNGTNVTVVSGSALRSNPIYVTYYIFWSKFILIEVIPYLIILVLNSLIIGKIWKSTQFRKRFVVSHSLECHVDLLMSLCVVWWCSSMKRIVKKEPWKDRNECQGFMKGLCWVDIYGAWVVRNKAKFAGNIANQSKFVQYDQLLQYVLVVEQKHETEGEMSWAKFRIVNFTIVKKA